MSYVYIYIYVYICIYIYIYDITNDNNNNDNNNNNHNNGLAVAGREGRRDLAEDELEDDDVGLGYNIMYLLLL